MTAMAFRGALAALLSLIALFPAAAQDGATPRRVGILFSGLPSDPAAIPVRQALADGLREHGWEEGRDVLLEVRFAGPDPASYPALAANLVALKVDVIMTANTQALEAARRATTIPIVMAGATVSEKLGFVASFARPGGNITGLVNQAETVSGKALQLLKEIKPGIERVGIVYSPDNIASAATFKAQQEEMAPRLGLVVVPVPVSKPADFDAAFATIVRERAQALIVYQPPVVFAHRARIAAFAIEQRLPTACLLSVMARDGLLISYGYNNSASWRRAAWYVDRIFRGANPAEMPIEQVDRFELVVNLRTARQLGVTIPASILLRADEVIE